MSGTGLKRAGSLLEEQTVEDVRNVEDGTDRGLDPSGTWTPAGRVRCRGAEPQEGSCRFVRSDGEDRRVTPWRDAPVCGSSRGHGPGRYSASKTSQPEERQGGSREPKRG
jgi:hypothetical protein